MDATEALAPTPGSTFTPAPSTPTRSSTFETPEERAKKQVYIVRQSSISNAISLLTTGAKVPPATSAVIALAKELEAYVFDSGAVDKPASFEDMADDLDDVPL